MYVRLLCSVLFLWSTASFFLPITSASMHTDDFEDFDFDLISFDEDEDYQLMEYLDTAAMDHISRAINPVDIMNYS